MSVEVLHCAEEKGRKRKKKREGRNQKGGGGANGDHLQQKERSEEVCITLIPDAMRSGSTGPRFPSAVIFGLWFQI
ncbi:hypothetical protein AXG93_1335s1100 [Marchantia polymorpha subsp. ruderalis]|uniref:Uncharacterized protein n=1 Tax=Marchantia polymorpha subsp. ruderalis TaxID=1480154 RepID=A0A176W6F9_MARPO|nr:hypothetical protein AXG93_1335s1100 [Marchantia polymorpha subsp. ruderalis]